MTQPNQKLDAVHNSTGFIAALDQSGGSTPKALKMYGVDESEWPIDAHADDAQGHSDLRGGNRSAPAVAPLEVPHGVVQILDHRLDLLDLVLTDGFGALVELGGAQ